MSKLTSYDLISVAKADSLSNENQGVVRTKVGIAPKPLRKRAYHRALKRKESWALHEKAIKDMIDYMNRIYNYPPVYPIKMIGLKAFLDE